MSKAPVVIDTNVPVTANGHATHADLDCQTACIVKLMQIQAQGRVLVDAHGLIFTEYSHHLSHAGQPGAGDAFFKWLWNNQGQPALCTKVPIEPEDEAGQEFPGFPEDPELQNFDRSDRKFVAVALASGENPPIVNATDTDWWIFREALNRNGVQVEFLCPQHTGE
jgi:hypothetical protein